jgi:3-hydroxyisobutyrate dehydrogenase-like beta-hydroxyacid dehydrogenase
MVEKVGFIGMGEMGLPMAQNLLKAGHQLWVTDKLSDRVEQIVKSGAVGVENSADIAKYSELSIVMVPTPMDVKEAILGTDGLFYGIRSPHTCIIMSTVDPMTVQEVAVKLAEKEVETIDCPVARSRAAAEKGTLAIFVGGSKKVYKRCLPVLQVMGSDIVHVGELGSGQVVKIINNMILGVSVAVLSEALVLGGKAGLDPDILMQCLEAGSADSFALRHHMKTYAMKDDLEGRFPVNYIMKDLDLALNTGQHLHVPLIFTALAQQIYERARASGWENLYYPVILHDLENLTGIKVRSKNV